MKIKANNLTLLPDPPKGLACEHAGPTANVQDSVPLPIPAASATGRAQAPKIAGTKPDS
jgi:hypothetical protein